MVRTTRKGANRVADVPAEILLELNTGHIEAATLAENLATDFSVLLSNVFPELKDVASDIDPKVGVTKRMSFVADAILQHYGETKFAFLASHKSDLVRGWAAYIVAELPDLPLETRIKRMRPFADDHHFGVREWSWLALRPHIVASPREAVEVLSLWTNEKSEYLRRFAVEATRPRGVWSAHIAILKNDPSLALPILEPLCGDPSRYVQDSVANWLNDAYKSRPDWVEKICKDWLRKHENEAIQYIVKRALRNQKR